MINCYFCHKEATIRCDWCNTPFCKKHFKRHNNLECYWIEEQERIKKYGSIVSVQKPSLPTRVLRTSELIKKRKRKKIDYYESALEDPLFYIPILGPILHFLSWDYAERVQRN